MNKINVVHLVEDLKIGGLERIIETIIREIDKEAFNISVWCLSKGGEIYDELKKDGFSVDILMMKSHRNPLFYIKLARKLKENNIHIVHTHGLTADTIGRLAAIFSKVPVIIAHIHTTHIKHSFKNILKDRLLSIFTDKIICCSRAVADFVVNKERINPKRVTVIYNGVGIDKFSDTPSNVTKDTFVIGCVASLSPHKGHKYLLEAVRKVREKSSCKVKLILVGDGILRDELESYAQELGIQELIEFKGILLNVSYVIPAFDVAVLPSCEREGLGLSLIEAMAAGKPVVGTNIGGISEVISNGDNGLLVPPKDSDALAKAILLILNDKHNAIVMGKQGRDIAESRFSSQIMIKKIEELYQDLLKRKYDTKI